MGSRSALPERGASPRGRPGPRVWSTRDRRRSVEPRQERSGGGRRWADSTVTRPQAAGGAPQAVRASGEVLGQDPKPLERNLQSPTVLAETRLAVETFRQKSFDRGDTPGKVPMRDRTGRKAQDFHRLHGAPETDRVYGERRPSQDPSVSPAETGGRAEEENPICS